MQPHQEHCHTYPRNHPEHHENHASMIQEYQTLFWISVGLTLPILLLSPMIQDFLGLEGKLSFKGDRIVLFILSCVIYFYGGWPFLKGLKNELQQKQPGMMTLVGVAISAAYLYSSAVAFGLPGKMFFWELATLIDIMLLGHWIEMKSVMGASRALEELATLLPDTAHKLSNDGSTQEVPVKDLKKGDRVLVKPGERIPGDGHITAGITSVNESMLTGESKPIHKSEGDGVIGGSINGEGSITLLITKIGEEAFLSGVINLVREAQESKSKTQDLANRAARWLTIIALGIGGLTLFIWVFVSSEGLAFAMERAVTVMVIACPHALGLAVPLVVAVSTSIAAAKGLLIRNRAAFEQAKDIQAIIFDKTGTLTKGSFGLTEVICIDNTYNQADILHYASAIERLSEHPLAQAIANASQQLWEATDFRAIPGKGAKAIVHGRAVKVVSPGYLKEANIAYEDPTIENLMEQGKTVVFVLIDEQLVGAIALADIIRPESKQAITLLKRMGIQCMMLTGDNKQVAQWVANEIGLDEYFAEVLPGQKAEKIKEVQARGLVVAMTGDGVNDAPALAQADVGIAIGAGTDIAIETADIILVKSNPMDVANLIWLARATYRKMRQNLLWATGYNVFAIPAAAGIFHTFGLVLSPAIGAVFMSLSTIICAINSKLLKLN
jgi:P-type Cu2+ transporter